MRFIAIALLALLVCTTVMAAEDVYGNSSWDDGIEQTYWTYYDGSSWITPVPGNPITSITVAATVAPWCTETLHASKIDFAFNRTGVDLMSDPVLNDCFANFAYAISITPTPGDPDCDISKMKLVTPASIPGGYGTGATTFDIEWWMQGAGVPLQQCGYIYSSTTPAVKIGVQGPTYYGGGSNSFNWMVKAKPVQHQAPGAYVLDPLVVIAPTM